MKKFLLHICCGPCSIAVIDELKTKFDLTAYFYNPNIYPIAEYEKRKQQVIKVCNEWQVPMIDGDYEPAKWAQAIKGLEREKEGGPRCSQCILMRLNKTAEFAKQEGYELFSTTLSMGRFKEAKIINPLGRMLGQIYGVQFYEEDWKKQGRWDKGRSMAQDRKLYIQNYCGCIYSLRAYQKRARLSQNDSDISSIDPG